MIGARQRWITKGAVNMVMTDLYILFDSVKARRNFVAEMLGLAPESKQLDRMEEGNGPFYKIFKEVRKGNRVVLQNIYAKGFRRVYYQKVHRRHPGYWLVIQLRQSKAAIETELWIRERVPAEQFAD